MNHKDTKYAMKEANPNRRALRVFGVKKEFSHEL